MCDIEEGADPSALFIEKCRLYSYNCSLTSEEDREYIEIKKEGLDDMVQFVTDYKEQWTEEMFVPLMQCLEANLCRGKGSFRRLCSLWCM